MNNLSDFATSNRGWLMIVLHLTYRAVGTNLKELPVDNDHFTAQALEGYLSPNRRELAEYRFARHLGKSLRRGL
jgi:hypothetical protein